MDGERQGEMQEEKKKKRHKTFHPHPPVSGERDHCVHLPIDVIWNILSRLSVRALGRFRCVCKQWRSLTRDNRFALEQHARGALARPPSILQTHKKTCRQYNPPPKGGVPGVVTAHVYDIVERGLLTAHRIYKCVTSKCCRPSSNFIHGLTCMMDTDSTDSSLSVLNPTTREVAKLPTSGRTRCQIRDYLGLHGFGYDATMGEYKVVGIYGPWRGCKYSCEVLTLGSGRMWRHLGIVPYDFISVCELGVPPVFLHGAIHWVGFYPPDYVVNPRRCFVALLTFDVKDEKFGLISPPLKLELDVFLRVVELRGNLAVVFWDRNILNILNIWCLKNYASNEWTQGWRIHSIDCSGCTFFLPLGIAPICYAGKESLLLFDAYAGGVYSYDLCSKNFSKIYDMVRCSTAVYSESLLSPQIFCRQSGLTMGLDGFRT